MGAFQPQMLHFTRKCSDKKKFSDSPKFVGQLSPIPPCHDATGRTDGWFWWFVPGCLSPVYKLRLCWLLFAGSALPGDAGTTLSQEMLDVVRLGVSETVRDDSGPMTDAGHNVSESSLPAPFSQLHRLNLAQNKVHCITVLFHHLFSPPVYHHGVCSVVTAIISLQSSVMVETRLESVYNTHVPCGTHCRSQSGNKYVSTRSTMYYGSLHSQNTV